MCLPVWLCVRACVCLCVCVWLYVCVRVVCVCLCARVFVGLVVCVRVSVCLCAYLRVSCLFVYLRGRPRACLCSFVWLSVRVFV